MRTEGGIHTLFPVAGAVELWQLKQNEGEMSLFAVVYFLCIKIQRLH